MYFITRFTYRKASLSESSVMPNLCCLESICRNSLNSIVS